MSEDKNSFLTRAESLSTRAREMSGQELLMLGVSQVAYCRTVMQDGTEMVAIHAADGTPMAIAEDEASALNAILEHEMVPALLQ